jgi:serine/threonine protein phosphatase PrpC
MEDADCIQQVCKNTLCVGVFDGHGGDDVAKFCVNHFPTLLENEIKLTNDVAVALRNVYDLLDEGVKSYSYTGACACIVVVHKGRVWFSNCGDTMAMCKISNGIPKWQSIEHKVANERQRIITNGGIILSTDGCPRVAGILNISRSIGDWALKQWVVSTPYISSVSIHSNEMYVVIASDGLWDVTTPEQFDAQLKKFYKQEQSYSACLRRIAETAYQNGSTDNITIILCFIKNKV